MTETTLDAFHYHEALDRTSFVMDIISDGLLIHPAIQSNAQWVRDVENAIAHLMDVYQAIGEFSIPVVEEGGMK